jgi:glycosidase
MFLCRFLIPILLLTVHSTSAVNAPERVEPANWWIGMKSQFLQVLVKAPLIAKMDVQFNYPGLRLLEIHPGDHPDYLFLDFEVSDQMQAGDCELNFYNPQIKGKKQYQYTYRFLKREEGSSQRKGFSGKDVIYLICPDRFVNGDPSNDSKPDMPDKLNRNDPSGRHGGDIQGIIQSLGYLQQLGITSLWINPLVENNMPQHSYHGYAITDYYKIDPRYGDLSLYLKLVQEAKLRGMTVIADQVANHCGSSHWWMKALPFKDWINYPDSAQFTNHMRSTLQDPHAVATDRTLFSDGWFVPTMPDLNQRNSYVANYLIQNSIWWVETAGLGGIRMDTYSYPDKAFMNVWSKRLMDEYPNFSIVGEEWSGNPAIVAQWQAKDQVSEGASALTSLMDFPIQAALVKALTQPENWNSGWILLYEALANDFLYPHPEKLVLFGDNHDMDRFYSQLGANPALFRLGMVYLLTTQRIPQIMYGTEMLMQNEKHNNHGEIRSDFPGGWKGDSVSVFTNKGLSVEQIQAQQFIIRLLTWRKASDVIHSGSMVHFAPQNGVYVYAREKGNNSVLVLLNKENTPITINLKRFSSIIRNRKIAWDVLKDQEMTVSDELILSPVSAKIIEF